MRRLFGSDPFVDQKLGDGFSVVSLHLDDLLSLEFGHLLLGRALFLKGFGLLFGGAGLDDGYLGVSYFTKRLLDLLEVEYFWNTLNRCDVLSVITLLCSDVLK